MFLNDLSANKRMNIDELELNPNALNIEFKPKFIERYEKLTDFEAFKKVSLSYVRKAIRVNTLKTQVNNVIPNLKDWQIKQVPWCKEGFWIKSERFDLGNLYEHALGYIYVQEASSMIPPVVLDPQPGEFVLDMAAAPGSKTSQIAQYMKNEGLLIANDVNAKRLKILGANLQRMGVTNTVVTQLLSFRKKEVEFDRILVDGPCSGTGTIMKSLKTINMWNPGGIKKMSGIQKQLLETGFLKLKEGGTLIYSTCTMEPEENEAVVDSLLKKYDNTTIEKIDLNINRSKPILEFENNTYDKRINNCLRIWPQDNNTEGFFVAKIKKE